MLKESPALIFVLLVAGCIQAKDTKENSDKDKNSNHLHSEKGLSWEARGRLRKLFPAYLTGFDEEERPVFYANYGRWDLRSFMEAGGSNPADFDRYISEMYQQIWDSPKTYGKEINQYIVLSDLDGFDLRQISYPPSVQKMIGMCAKLLELEKKEARAYKLLIFNANYMFRTLYTILRPALGHLTDLIEIHGTNSAHWKPLLFKQVPQNQLPPALGGFANHTLLQIGGNKQ